MPSSGRSAAICLSASGAEQATAFDLPPQDVQRWTGCILFVSSYILLSKTTMDNWIVRVQYGLGSEDDAVACLAGHRPLPAACVSFPSAHPPIRPSAHRARYHLARLVRQEAAPREHAICKTVCTTGEMWTRGGETKTDRRMPAGPAGPGLRRDCSSPTPPAACVRVAPSLALRAMSARAVASGAPTWATNVEPVVARSFRAASNC